jgi:hypothetical protein
MLYDTIGYAGVFASMPTIGGYAGLALRHPGSLRCRSGARCRLRERHGHDGAPRCTMVWCSEAATASDSTVQACAVVIARRGLVPWPASAHNRSAEFAPCRPCSRC